MPTCRSRRRKKNLSASTRSPFFLFQEVMIQFFNALSLTGALLLLLPFILFLSDYL